MVAPGEDPYAAVVEPAEVFLAAAGAAGVRRVVVCSPAAVGTAAGNHRPPHLAAKAEVERMVAASGLEHAILRCTHVLGPDSRLLDLLRPPRRRSRSRATAPAGRPVWVGDVAAAIAAADDAVELAATWSLSGPDEVSFDALVDAVHGGPVAKHHLAAAAGLTRDPPVAWPRPLADPAAGPAGRPGPTPPGLAPPARRRPPLRIAAAAEQPGGTAGG